MCSLTPVTQVAAASLSDPDSRINVQTSYPASALFYEPEQLHSGYPSAFGTSVTAEPRLTDLTDPEEIVRMLNINF